MMIKRFVRAVGGLAADGVLLLIRGVAVLLGTTRLGRVIRAVSIPRLQAHRLRTTLTISGISLGVAVLVAVVIVNGSVERGVASTIEDLAGTTDLQVSAGSSGFDEELLMSIRSVAGVAHAVPVMQQIVTIRDTKTRGERLLILGVDLLDDADSEFREYRSDELDAIRREPLSFLNSAENILISRSVAKRFGYKLHDKIPVVTSRGVSRFDIWGFLEDEGVGRAFGGAVAVMYYPAMQVAFDRGHNLDRIDLTVKDHSEVNAVQADLRKLLGSGFVVETPALKGARLGRMLLSIRSGLSVASLIALLVGAYLIHNTMAISVVQRKREIGVLRALGSQRREIVQLLTLEGALLGAVGGLLGSGLGVLLSKSLLSATSHALNETHLQLAATNVVVEPWILLAGFVVGVVASTLASAVPARRAALNRPAETLRTSGITLDVNIHHRPARYDVIALLLLAATPVLLKLPLSGLIPWGAFAAAAALNAAAALLMPRAVQIMTPLLRPLLDRMGVEARLAHRNLPRDVGRTAATAGALTAAIGLVISFSALTYSFVSTLDDWITQTLPGDLFVTQSSSIGGTSLRNVPMADTLYEPLSSMPEVKTVRRLSLVDIPYGGYTVKIISTDIDVFLRNARLMLIEGDSDTLATKLKGGEVAVSENFMRHFGAHRGDTVWLSTQHGTRPFKVAAVMIDYSSDFGSILFDRPNYMATFDDRRVDTYELHLRDPATAERVRRRINEEFGTSHDLFVLTNREFRAEVNRTTDQLFSLVRALELVALIVAVLGIINAQFANVLDRVREIGVMRALGMQRRQVRLLIVSEACLVGVIGSVAGLCLGVALGYVLLEHINLVQTGWYFPYRLSTRSVLEVALVTLPAAAAAGFYPAREAARLVITDALEYE